MSEKFEHVGLFPLDAANQYPEWRQTLDERQNGFLELQVPANNWQESIEPFTQVLLDSGIQFVVGVREREENQSALCPENTLSVRFVIISE